VGEWLLPAAHVSDDPKVGDDSVPTMLLPELTVLPLHTSHWFGPSAIGRTLDVAASCAIRNPFSGASEHR
jgi:hypothetical protein